MSAYAIALACGHNTMPDVVWRVITYERRASGQLDITTKLQDDEYQHRLEVPRLDVWTPDVLRMVLHELAAFLPAHDADEATATIEVAVRKPRGRRPADVPVPPRLDHVNISVEARGWRAAVWTNENLRGESEHKPEDPWPTAGTWSEPMVALLLDLAAKSPLALGKVAIVESEELDVPSRRAQIRGLARQPQPQQRFVDDCTQSLRELLTKCPDRRARTRVLVAFKESIATLLDNDDDA